MNGEQTFNLNAAECIKSQIKWGETVTHNICTGEVYSVPWGAVDYGAGLFGLLFLLTLALMLVIMIKLVFE